MTLDLCSPWNGGLWAHIKKKKTYKDMFKPLKKPSWSFVGIFKSKFGKSNVCGKLRAVVQWCETGDVRVRSDMSQKWKDARVWKVGIAREAVFFRCLLCWKSWKDRKGRFLMAPFKCPPRCSAKHIWKLKTFQDCNGFATFFGSFHLRAVWSLTSSGFVWQPIQWIPVLRSVS